MPKPRENEMPAYYEIHEPPHCPTCNCGIPDRHVEQARGSHAAPCGRHCEAVAFGIELRSLRALLKLALPHVEASAEASHLTEGFRRGQDNELDKLAARIKYVTHDA